MTPQRGARFAEDEESTVDAGSGEGEEGEVEEEAAAEQTPGTPKVSRAERKSPVKGQRRTKVPFKDPSKQPLDQDGNQKPAATIVKEHTGRGGRRSPNTPRR
jgi:hypothetical protein